MIVTPSTFDINEVSYTDVKRSSYAGYRNINWIYLNYAGGMLTLQTPEMYLPFDLCEKVDNDNAWDLHLSFRDIEKRRDLQKFYEMLKMIETSIVYTVIWNKDKLFSKKKYTLDMIQSLFMSSIVLSKRSRIGSDGKVTHIYPPTLKIRVPKQNADAYDKNKNRVRLDREIIKGGRATVIMQCTGIWIAAGFGYGCVWKARQIRLTPGYPNGS